MSPLSGDAEARGRQLANLRPGARPAPQGNARARTHGGYAVIVAARLDEKVTELFDALALDAPLRDPDGSLPAHDTLAVRELAEVACRLEDVRLDIRRFGELDQESALERPVVTLEDRLSRRLLDLMRELGLTPASRAKLGLDLVRSREALTDHLADKYGGNDGP